MKRILITFAACACVVACNKDLKPQQTSDVQEVSETKVDAQNNIDDFVKFVTEENDLSLEDTEYIEAEIKEIKAAVSSDGYKKIVINYPSVNTKGEKITLSGAIYLPLGASTFDKILLYCHQTATNDKGVPSGNGILCLEPLLISKTPSTVCFGSDYIGFGTSKQCTHPYMNNAIAARNEVDMMKAGIVYLQSKGYTIKSADEGLQTYVFGFSQGGSVALATHKLIEEDTQLCKDLNFCGSLCGAGPYNLRTTFKKFYNDQTMIMPILLPYVLIGMYESYPEDFAGIDIYDYMSKKCKNAGVVEYLKSQPAIADALSWGPNKIGIKTKEILSSDAQNLNGKLMTILFNALDKQNLLDGSWTPKYPVIIYHSSKDNIVSYGNAEEALKLFPSNVCHRSSLDNNKGHMLEYVHFANLCITKGIPAMMNN